ncbi:S-adenosylmethionine-dependent methyltransferase-like protein [Podospora aff. communis PSN243]|uniref:40S ribosomal protein S24 n=1 Tax=Podospora aff. communis PSN243 TaxID=3040156 RepID=A0AAV9G482_9PEZI|nr:S-adenosylmethionine-dependent methyltransferase-like protein [Podospora aff. communis PSN243]
MVSLTPERKAQIDRFCWQFLQLDQTPEFPDDDTLRDADAQEALYRRVFAPDAVALPPPPRYQLRILKALVARIEGCITDWDEHGISDELMESLSNLLSLRMPDEAVAAQQKCYVTYHLSRLARDGGEDAEITLLESRSLLAAGGTTGLRTWEAALHLGEYLCANPGLIRGKRVLELGAGTGYLGVLCAKYLGAGHVLVSDGSEDVINNLPDSFFLNGLQGASCVSPLEMRWGHALVGTEEQAWNGGRRVDVLLGADITYDESVIPSLVATLEEVVDLFPGVIIIIAATERNRKTFQSFLDVCERRGFATRHPTAKMADSDAPVTLRTRKFIRNPLLGRKQMVVDILHPGRANIAKEELREKLAGLYKANKEQVSVFGLRTQFGGGKTTGFALVYDSPEAMKKFEPHYRLVRVGLATKIERASRQQRKQRKNRQKTLRGTAKVKGAKAKKEK